MAAQLQKHVHPIVFLRYNADTAAVMPQSSSSPFHWNFYQILGHRAPADELNEDDIITTIQFEKGGDYLAIGDHGGRIVIFERDDRKFNLSREDPPCQDVVSDEEIADTGTTFHAKCQKVYAQDQSFNINSISNNSDAETFISADEFRINLWNLEVSDRNFNIIDMKPSNMEDDFEIITSAEFHPVHCNLLTYGSSKGLIRISDLRQAARCDRSVRLFLDQSLLRLKFPFEEMAACISDVKFLVDGIGGQQLISRDYLSMKLWDMRMDSRPVATFRIHEHLRPRLAELFNKDHIFDQFDCCFSRDGLSFATGSYGNRLKIFSIGNGSVEDIKLDIIGNIDSYRMPLLPSGTVRRSPIIGNIKRGFDQGCGRGNDLDDGNLSSKLLHVAWHPTYNLVAGAAQSSLILVLNVPFFLTTEFVSADLAFPSTRAFMAMYLTMKLDDVAKRAASFWSQPLDPRNKKGKWDLGSATTENDPESEQVYSNILRQCFFHKKITEYPQSHAI
ncbi:serine/threonine protein phosphatase 2A 55 kDa regulatory subunit B alpha isoform [Neltuma alba]|uniref:serine/threonine protein phosphatase 2A 55 kDa regulatory subunit B alpha isoform n=1 Tax=Neltuma alba TaxID=207710 RepID=UPI0010A38776|nr:serine/threonine protein phosphatase 2A 55 kDa regulatory subunit B alpha isoform-like [Prosopis alba]